MALEGGGLSTAWIKVAEISSVFVVRLQDPIRESVAFENPATLYRDRSLMEPEETSRAVTESDFFHRMAPQHFEENTLRMRSDSS